MSRSMSRRLLAAPLLSAALLLAGCGGGTTPSATESTAPASTAPASTSASTSEEASVTPSSDETGDGGIDDTYWPAKVGNRWVYKATYTGGLGIVDHTITVTAVRPVTGGAMVTMRNTYHYRNGSAADFAMPLTWLFHTDGSITVPYQVQGAAGARVKVLSGSMVWPSPADYDAGTVRRGRLEVQTTIAGRVFRSHVDATIKPAGLSSENVPAGSFMARRIDSHLVSTVTVGGVTQSVPIDTQVFLAEGIGLVKTVFAQGSTQGTEVLVRTNVQ